MSYLNDSSTRILFQLTGSIACFKACEVISALVQKGFEVQTVCSKGALDFIGIATLEGLTGRRVFTDSSEPGRVMDHIHLSRWADIAVLCPATAKTLNHLAAGTATGPIGDLFLSYEFRRKPYLVFPAMNSTMIRHPSVERSIVTLKEWAVRVYPTEEGRLACGETGEGRLLPPERIMEATLQAIREMRER